MGKHSRKNHDPDDKEKQLSARALKNRVFLQTLPPEDTALKRLNGESLRHPPGKVLKFTAGKRYEVQTSGALKRI